MPKTANDNKYYQKQTKDLTDKIQQRIKEYTSHMYNDKLIALIRDDVTKISLNVEPRLGGDHFAWFADV